MINAYMKPIVGVLLAGGLARRMGGGDKPLRTLGGKPILGRVVDCVRPQVHQLILNANGDPARFDQYDLPVVPDVTISYRTSPYHTVPNILYLILQYQPLLQYFTVSYMIVP